MRQYVSLIQYPKELFPGLGFFRQKPIFSGAMEKTFFF